MINPRRSIRLFLPGMLVLLVAAMAAREAAAAIPSGAQAWAYSTLSYRREVQLPADPSRSRTNVPIWVDLKQLGAVDLGSIKVDEITADTPVKVSVTAYAQSSGRDPRAYWVASGTTSAGKTRRFLLYFNKVSASAYSFSTSRSGATGGSYAMAEHPLRSFNRYEYTLTSDRLEFKRFAYTTDKSGDSNHAIFYGNNASYTWMKDLRSGFKPLGGLRLSYIFRGPQFNESLTFFGETDQDRAFESIKADRNGPTVAMSARYSISTLLPHRTEVTHRLFQSQPLLEISLAATPNSGPLLEFANDIYSARQFYWDSAAFSPTRMITDLGYDGAVSTSIGSKNYQILVNSAGNAIGVFTFRPSVKRKFGSNALQELYELASEQGSVYVYYGMGKLDEIQSLFTTMKRGYPLGLEEVRGFNIMQPLEGQRFIPGESITAGVAGSSLGTDLALKVTYPDGSSKSFTKVAAGTRAYAFSLGAIPSTAKFGTWTLSATSGGVTKTRKIVVANPDHPRLLFTQADLAAMRQRWTSGDARYASHIKSRLTSKAGEVLAKALPPTTLSDTDGPRDYGRDLMQLVGAHLMASTKTEQDKYGLPALQRFRIMMAWRQWDPIGNGCKPFNGEDLERGEVLYQLALAYDILYGYLGVTERRQYAEQFARYADGMLASDYANIIYPRWTTFDFIANNRALEQSAAVAALDRVTAPEIADARHAPWKARLDINWANLLQTLSADGTYNSGQSYHALFLWALGVWSETRRLNTGDLSLHNTSWAREVPYYVLYGMLPGRVGNFGGVMPYGNCDSWPYYSMQTDMGLFGKRGNRVAQWIAEESDYSRVEPYQPFWLEYGKPRTEPLSLPNWHTFWRSGIFVYRSSWSDNAMYFSTKCGEYWGGHEHPDAGTFVIHRNGYPYIAAPHYLNRIDVTNENILVANGKGPRGRAADNGMYSDTVAPAYWGKTLSAFGSPNFFNVLQDPRSTYEDGSNLTSYKREFVGFPDMVLMRDTITASAATSLKLLLHGYQTDTQTDAGRAYDPNQYPGVQVFVSAGGNKTLLYPNRTSTPNERMAIYDLSRSTWSPSIGPWRVTPAFKPGWITPGSTRAGNSRDVAYDRGGQLTRSLTASSASSLLLFSFKSDSYGARKWNTTVSDDGLVVYAGARNVVKVVWPKGGKMDAALYKNNETEGLTVVGAMAMRNYDTQEFGGRALTFLRDASPEGRAVTVPLLSSTMPVRLVSQTASGGNVAWIGCDVPGNVTLYTPRKVKSAVLDGKPVAFTISGARTTFSLPAAPWGGFLYLTYY